MKITVFEEDHDAPKIIEFCCPAMAKEATSTKTRIVNGEWYFYTWKLPACPLCHERVEIIIDRSDQKVYCNNYTISA